MSPAGAAGGLHSGAANFRRDFYRELMASKDVGVQAVEGLFRDLMIDQQWAIRRPRGFTWWAYRLAQHVEVAPPTSDGVHEVCEVRVWTDVANKIDPTRHPATVVGVANMQQTLNALVWDPVERSVTECCKVVVTEENIGWLGKVLTWAAVLQNTAAHSRAHGVANVLGGVLAASNHPRSGERPSMDDILNVPTSLIAPAGKKKSAFAGPFTEALGPFAVQFGLLGFADAHGFTCEVPFTGSRPAAMLVGEPPETALVKVFANAPHPAFGNGALLTMSLPPDFDKERVPAIANQLNLAESKVGTDTMFLGAWCSDPTSNKQRSLAFCAFIPNVLAQPGLLENMVIYQARRSRFVASVLGPGGELTAHT